MIAVVGLHVAGRTLGERGRVPRAGAFSPPVSGAVLAWAAAGSLVAVLAGPLVAPSARLHARATSSPMPDASVWQVPPGSVRGRIRDDEGVAIFAATVRILRGDTLVRLAETDRLGFFRLDGLRPAVYDLRVARLGYGDLARTVAVTSAGARELDLVLTRAAVPVPGVSVEAERSRDRARFEELAGVTMREMSLADLKGVPGIAEADPVRAVEVLPGVVSTSDFSAAFNVRGSSADQNLILLDGIPVFSPFHLGGFFSVFNADMLSRVELSSGGFGAEHGERVSSVMNVETDAGDGRFRMDGGVSLLAGRLAAGGGLPRDLQDGLGLSAAHWRVSARRSYFDLVLAPFLAFPYHLRDVQGVLEAWTRGGDRLDVTAYTGRDVLDLTGEAAGDFPLGIRWSWGNDVVGARWTRPLRGGGSLGARVGYSSFGSGLRFPDFADTEFRSRVGQVTLGAALEHPLGPRLRLAVGADAYRLAYDNLATTGGTVFGRGLGSGWFLGAYARSTWRSEPDWLVEAGVRLDGWRPDPGRPVVVPSPRLAVKRFFADGEGAFKVAGGRYTQFLHSLRDEELPVGLDIWILAGDRAPHVVSDQVQVGVERRFPGGWEASAEAYLRTFDGVVTFNAADDPNDDLDDILVGEGTSWGVDLLLRRTEGPVSGWLSISWLKATRSFPDLLSPLEPRPVIEYPPIFDRRLDVDLVLRLPLPWGWTGGLRWNVGTGVPYTRPLGTFAYYRPRFAGEGGRLFWTGSDDLSDTFGTVGVLLGDRNGARYPTYHRLDVSARKEMVRSWGTLVPYVDVLNVYNRKNVLFYAFDFDRTSPVRSGVSMFPLLPTVGVEFRFP